MWQVAPGLPGQTYGPNSHREQGSCAWRCGPSHFHASALTDVLCGGTKCDRCPRRALAHLQALFYIDGCRLPFVLCPPFKTTFKI